MQESSVIQSLHEVIQRSAGLSLKSSDFSQIRR
jgi:hypothetical protein